MTSWQPSGRRELQSLRPANTYFQQHLLTEAAAAHLAPGASWIASPPTGSESKNLNSKCLFRWHIRLPAAMIMDKWERYGLVWDAPRHRCQGSAFQVNELSYLLLSVNNEEEEIWPPLKDVYLRNSMYWLQLMFFIFPVLISAMCVQVTTEWPGLIQHPEIIDFGPSLSHLSQW